MLSCPRRRGAAAPRRGPARGRQRRGRHRGGTELHARRGADRPRQVRRLSPAGRNRAVRLPHRTRRLLQGDADRGGRARAQDAAVATGAEVGAVRRAGAAHADALPSATRSCAGFAPAPESTARRSARRRQPTTRPRAGRDAAPPAAAAPYTPRSASGATDDYRCFMLDPKLAEDAFATSIRIEPDADPPRAPRDPVPRCRRERRRGRTHSTAPRPGRAGAASAAPASAPPVERPARSRSLDNAPWIAAWAPGWGGDRLPEGVGVALPAGSRVVMQVHYNLLNGRRPDRSRAVLTTVPASAGLTAARDDAAAGAGGAAVREGRDGPAVRPHRGALRPGAQIRPGRRASSPSACFSSAARTRQIHPQARVTFCDPAASTGPTTIHAGRRPHAPPRPLDPSRAQPRHAARQGAARHPALELPLAGVVRSRDSRSQAQAGDVLRVTCRHDATLRKQHATAGGAEAPLHPLGRRDDRRDVPRHRPGHRGPEPRRLNRTARAHPPRLADVSRPVGARPGPLRGCARA